MEHFGPGYAHVLGTARIKNWYFPGGHILSGQPASEGHFGPEHLRHSILRDLRRGESHTLQNLVTNLRIFSGSFESAIYLLSMICSIPSNVSVLPAINSNFTHHISAGLEDGTTIAGQVAISHPSAPTALPDDVKISLATPSFPPLLHGGHGHYESLFFMP